MRHIVVLRPGMFTTVQDLGRWGFQAYGVPVSGAMDPRAHGFANALVGNARHAASLEITLTGPHLRFDDEAVFAVSGALFDLSLDGTPASMNAAVRASRGSVLAFGARRTGARAYLAVDGGIDVELVLGSRSTHVLSGLGGFEGRALRAGDQLPLGRTNGGMGVVERQSWSAPAIPDGGASVRFTVVDPALASELGATRHIVTPESNRMGYRLASERRLTAPTGGIISFGVPTGAIQVPPSGQPILLMADHATTGGYSLAGTVVSADLPIAGQLAPGDWISFEACS